MIQKQKPLYIRSEISLETKSINTMRNKINVIKKRFNSNFYQVRKKKVIHNVLKSITIRFYYTLQNIAVFS